MTSWIELLESLEPPRITVPRCELTIRERAIPPRLRVPKIPEDFFVDALERNGEWRLLMAAYREGKLDL